MKNTMEELLSGRVEQNRPELISSVSELRLQIHEGKNYKGSISLGAADGTRIKGLVTTDSHRILLASNHIAGDSCTVLFGVDTKGLREGERISGTILISCNLTELKIPLEAEIIREPVSASEGAIRTLEDFTRLCMKSFREGFRLFTSPTFTELLRGKNKTLLPLYQGLSHNPVTYQHLEEFLISAGKKQPVLFNLDKQEKAAYYLDVSQKDTLYIYKNNWGYARIEVEVKGSFLQVEKRVITSEDFIGKVYGLEYIVNREKLGPGRNYGSICLKSVYQELEFRIEASRGTPKQVDGLYTGRIMVSMYRDMLNLQLRKLDYRSWYERSCLHVAQLKEEDPEFPEAVLFDAYLAYTNDDMQKMQTYLSLFKKGSRQIETREQQVWYLYLAKKAGLLKPEEQNLVPMLKQYLEQEPDRYLYLHLLLEEDLSYEHMSARIMFELEQCFDRGCNSPFLYLKAWKMLNEQESLLRRLTPFYIQVLRFAAVRNILSESLYRRCAFLSGSVREFSEPIYELLAEGYKKYPDVDILEAICKLIMRGQAHKKEYFVWYSLAVEKELRITRLYEYYMDTIPESMAEEIPRQIRMYFAYNNTLGERRRALLYASVLKNKEADRTCYMNYQSTIRAFTSAALERGRMNESYAVLYQSIMARPATPQIAEKLAEVLFCNRVEVKNPNIRNVVVCHAALKEEKVYPCRDGVAYVDIYSEDACLLFEDEKKRRFGSTVEYSCEPLMKVKEIARNCMDFGVRHTGLELYCCKEKGWKMDVNSRTLNCYRMAEKNEDFSDSYRRKIRQKLLDYYMQNKEDERLLISVFGGDMKAFASVDKVSTAHLMIESGLYERAFALVSEFGYENIPEKLLLRLASRMILKMEFAEDEELLCLAEYVFRQGKYDEIILTYLLEQSMGSMEYLCELWERVRGFRLESLKLEKRILMLAAFVGKMPTGADRILENFILSQGQETVITAFLTWVSGGYFLRDLQVPELIFRYLEKLAGRNWELNLLCRLALLKYFAFQDSLTRDQEEEAKRILALCAKEDLRFAFMKKLPEHLISPYQIGDKLFVEERFLPGTKVTIHYHLGDGSEENPVWKSEPMQEMYSGIFTREFLLFYGEVLTWYLTIQSQDEELRLGEHQMTLTAIDTDGFSRYKLLNRILTAKALGNQERMETAVQDYLWQEAFTEHFCKIM